MLQMQDMTPPVRPKPCMSWRFSLGISCKLIMGVSREGG